MAFMKVYTNRLRKGMVIKNDVYARSGAIIVPENTVVTKEVHDILTRHFIEYVIVETEPDTKTDSIENKAEHETNRISEQQMQEFKESFHVAEDTLSQSLKDIAYHDKEIDMQSLLDMINSLLEKADGGVNLCALLMKMRESTESLYAHSINVSLFGQVLATWAGFTEEEIELVSMTGLLHDIGIMEYQQNGIKELKFHDVMDKKSCEKHVILGYNMIKEKNLDFRVKQAILTHHERSDGSGFPLAVPSGKINNISRVIAIADTYDILTMEEPGCEALSPFDVLKLMENSAYNKLDSRLLMIFIERMAQTFIQHEVLLNNGQKGKIVLINKFDIARPLVQIGSSFVDLSARKELKVQKVLD